MAIEPANFEARVGPKYRIRGGQKVSDRPANKVAIQTLPKGQRTGVGKAGRCEKVVAKSVVRQVDALPRTIKRRVKAAA